MTFFLFACINDFVFIILEKKSTDDMVTVCVWAAVREHEVVQSTG
jgi:hypothetical protein